MRQRIKTSAKISCLPDIVPFSTYEKFWATAKGAAKSVLFYQRCTAFTKWLANENVKTIQHISAHILTMLGASNTFFRKMQTIPKKQTWFTKNIPNNYHHLEAKEVNNGNWHWTSLRTWKKRPWCTVLIDPQLPPCLDFFARVKG